MFLFTYSEFNLQVPSLQLVTLISKVFFKNIWFLFRQIISKGFKILNYNGMDSLDLLDK